MSKAKPSHALVVGLGVSGAAAATLLTNQGWQVTVNDRAGEFELADQLGALPPGVRTVLGTHPEKLLDETRLVVVSPGIRWELPLLAEARRRGLPVIAEVELASRSLQGTPIIGITGSNGKTTVTALTGEMVRAAGWRVGVGGNIGTAACALALAGGWDAVVLELSSFQLEGCSTLRPRVGVLLNVSPDHLDRHPTMASYLGAKARIFACQNAEDFAVINADDDALRSLAVPSRVVRFSLRDRAAQAHLVDDNMVLDGEPLLPRSELPLLGDHNVANALAGALAAHRLGSRALRSPTHFAVPRHCHIAIKSWQNAAACAGWTTPRAPTSAPPPPGLQGTQPARSTSSWAASARDRTFASCARRRRANSPART
jgi:UDP-N-acetylmuramoylalanine--D-glutamate ligase